MIGLTLLIGGRKSASPAGVLRSWQWLAPGDNPVPRGHTQTGESVIVVYGRLVVVVAPLNREIGLWTPRRGPQVILDPVALTRGKRCPANAMSFGGVC